MTGRRLSDDIGLRRATFVYSLLLHHPRCFSDGRTVKWYSGDIPHKQIIALSLNLHNGGVRHAQLDMNPTRGHCNGTRYVARQVYCRHRLYSQIASCTWRAEVRKTFAFIVNNFQTVNVVQEVLSWLWYFRISLYIFWRRPMAYFCLCIVSMRTWIQYRLMNGTLWRITRQDVACFVFCVLINSSCLTTTFRK